MAAKPLPSPEVLRQLLRYEPETGMLFWRARPESMFREPRHCSAWNARYAGKEAFTALTYEYRCGRIFDQTHFAHRIAWTLHFGEWPSREIDHINMNRSDNRLCNMRLATRSENGFNKGKRSDNTSGFKGVSWVRQKKKWLAQIKSDGQWRFLGYHNSPEAAHKAYCDAALSLHGEFARVA